jgi:sugar phosphate isomerase/epimerase
MAFIRIAYDSSAWGSDGFTKCLDDLGELGFWGVEAPGELARQYYDKIYAFRQLLAMKGVRLYAMSGEANLGGSPEEIEKEIAFCKMACEFLCGNRGGVFVLNAGPRRPEGPSPDDLKRLAEFASPIGEFCKALGVKVCILPHAGRVVENRAEIEKVLEMADRSLVYFCPDTGLLAKLGENPADVIRAHAARIGHIHFKDYRPRAAEAGGEAEGGYAELGRGCVDFPAIMEILHAANYEGCVTIELEKGDTSPKESAAISKAYVENVLGIPAHPRPVPVIVETPARPPQAEAPAAQPAPAEQAPATRQEMPPVAPQAVETAVPQEAAATPPVAESTKPEEVPAPPAAQPSPPAEPAPAPAAPEIEPAKPEAVAAAPQETAPQEVTPPPEQPPQETPPVPHEPAPPVMQTPPSSPEPAPPVSETQPPEPPRKEEKEEKEEKGFGYGIFPDEQDDE